MPITTETIITRFGDNSETTLPTLQNRGRFQVIIQNGIVTIRNSGGNTHHLTDDHIAIIEVRYQELAKNNDGSHLKTTNYNQPRFNAPNMIFSPYLARIVHDIRSS